MLNKFGIGKPERDFGTVIRVCNNFGPFLIDIELNYRVKWEDNVVVNLCRAEDWIYNEE